MGAIFPQTPNIDLKNNNYFVINKIIGLTLLLNYFVIPTIFGRPFAKATQHYQILRLQCHFTHYMYLIAEIYIVILNTFLNIDKGIFPEFYSFCFTYPFHPVMVLARIEAEISVSRQQYQHPFVPTERGPEMSQLYRTPTCEFSSSLIG